MDVVQRCVVIIAVVFMLVGIQSCKPPVLPSGTYTVNTFKFVHSNTNQSTGETLPYVWIDTNTELSRSARTVTSSLPCAVRIDYTDSSKAFKAAVFTAVKITYDDDTVDPSTDSVRLPLRIAAREYESVNSVAGGRIVKSKQWIISGTIPKIVTRAEPFRLQLEGYFDRDDGSRLPFVIDQHFDIKTENATKSWIEVMQDI